MEKQIEDLVEQCKPIQNSLKKSFHPHITVEISADEIRVNETIYGLPFKDDGNDKHL